MPDKKAVLQCRLADESAATAYRESCLDDEDRARLLHAPKLAGQPVFKATRRQGTVAFAQQRVRGSFGV